MKNQLFIGYEPKPELINQVRNRHTNKAIGGIWTSTYIKNKCEWLEWCEEQDFYTTKHLIGWQLTVSENAKILTIDNFKDLESVYDKYPKKDYDPRIPLLDYEALSLHYDGLHLTKKGEWETRLTFPLSMYGWDCECTHWFRWVFDSVECMGDMSKISTI